GGSVPLVCVHSSSLGSQTQALLTFPQRLLRSPALGDVLDCAPESHNTPRRITLSFATSDEPSGGTIWSNHLQLKLVWRASRERLFNSTAQPFPTFGGIELGMLPEIGCRQIGIVAGDSIKFLRPHDDVSFWVPLPAPHSGQTLRFREFEVF